VPGEYPNQFSLRFAQLVVESTENSLTRKRLIILQKSGRKAGSGKGVMIEKLGKPAALIAKTSWLEKFYVLQRGVENLHL